MTLSLKNFNDHGQDFKMMSIENVKDGVRRDLFDEARRGSMLGLIKRSIFVEN